jgi:hypothetical protein
MATGYKQELRELEDKYFKLVWYARSNPEKHPPIAEYYSEIRKMYPEETRDLHDIEKGDWAHGFNSGMLACLRFVGGITSRSQMKKEFARREFPFLDT